MGNIIYRKIFNMGYWDELFVEDLCMKLLVGCQQCHPSLFRTCLLVNKTSAGNEPTVSRSIHIWLRFCSHHISRAKLVAYPLIQYSFKVLHLSVVFEDKDAEMGQILILFTVFDWINQQDAATSQFYYLSFKYSWTCFGHPHAHHQELQQLQ